MEEVLAGAASLVRHCLVTANDAIANGALGLALESTANVALKGRQTVNETSALWFTLA